MPSIQQQKNICHKGTCRQRDKTGTACGTDSLHSSCCKLMEWFDEKLVCAKSRSIWFEKLKRGCISVPARSLSSPHSYSAFFIQTLDTTVQPLLLSHSRFRSFLLCTTVFHTLTLRLCWHLSDWWILYFVHLCKFTVFFGSFSFSFSFEDKDATGCCCCCCYYHHSCQAPRHSQN